MERGAMQDPLIAFVQAIVSDDPTHARRLLSARPALAGARFEEGATRAAAREFFLEEIGRYIYAGDTALHIAAAAYKMAIVRELIAAGADVRGRNRRGSEPLHAAAAGMPGSHNWNPIAQETTVAFLIAMGADPNAVDKSGVAPLHVAVRTRCTAAVRALLAGGADAMQKNKSGSTPMLLATLNTGRGGSGSPEAIAEREQIEDLLLKHGAAR
jgi:hypothetical protein